MQEYVVCETRGNHPRIHVKICQQRCKHSKTCVPFQDYLKANHTDKMVTKPATEGWSPEEGIPAAAP